MWRIERTRLLCFCAVITTATAAGFVVCSGVLCVCVCVLFSWRWYVGVGGAEWWDNGGVRFLSSLLNDCAQANWIRWM